MFKISFLTPLGKLKCESGRKTGGLVAIVNKVSPLSVVEHSNVAVVCSDTFFDLGTVENIIFA